MDTWKAGDSGEHVRKVIENNFAEIVAAINQNASRYVKTFTASDWINGAIFIKQSDYNKLSPCVDLYIKSNDTYSIVFGGYSVSDKGVELQSDIPYEGKVVIR